MQIAHTSQGLLGKYNKMAKFATALVAASLLSEPVMGVTLQSEVFDDIEIAGDNEKVRCKYCHGTSKSEFCCLNQMDQMEFAETENYYVGQYPQMHPSSNQMMHQRPMYPQMMNMNKQMMGQPMNMQNNNVNMNMP